MSESGARDARSRAHAHSTRYRRTYSPGVHPAAARNARVKYTGCTPASAASTATGGGDTTDARSCSMARGSQLGDRGDSGRDPGSAAANNNTASPSSASGNPSPDTLSRHSANARPATAGSAHVTRFCVDTPPSTARANHSSPNCMLKHRAPPLLNRLACASPAG